MKQLVYEKHVNVTKLDGEIRAALPDVFDGLSADAAQCTVYLLDAATGADEQTVNDLVAAHDPTPLPDALIQAWHTIQAQAATRPLATMDIDQVTAWLASNITDAKTRTALTELAKEAFITRAQMAVIARALAYLFNQ